MKTQEQIKARIIELEVTREDIFGFQRSDLVDFLEFENT